MKIKDDSPIESTKDDLLNRSKFAEALSKALIKVKTNKSFCVGLFGEWGSGKTSIINLCMEIIHNFQDEENSPIIFKFDPWLISGQNSLTKSYLSELRKLLKNYSNSKTALKTSDLICEYEKYFESNYIYEDSFENNENINFFRDMINKELMELGHIIIVIIDDIDRLPDNEIIQIFKLIKSVADFPNIRYLVSFDKSIIVNALNKLQNNKGDKYLEKIVQINFELPLISSSTLYEFLVNEINLTFSTIKKLKFDEDYWVSVYHNGFKYFFNNLRDINKFINALNFNLHILPDAVNMVDFLAIIAIQVFEKDLYYEIRKNKDLFTLNDDDISNRSSLNSAEKSRFLENKTSFNKILSKVNENSQKNIKNLLEIIFPKFNEAYSENRIDLSNLNIWRRTGRVCVKEHFEPFFMLSISNEDISLIEIERILESSFSEARFNENIKTLIINNKILNFIDRLEDYTQEDIETESIQNIIVVLIDNADSFPNVKKSLFHFGTYSKISRIIYQLLNRVSASEKFDILKTSILKAENGILMILKTIDIEYELHSKNNTAAKILTKEQLDELKEISIKSLEKLIINKKILLHRNIYYILSKLMDWNYFGILKKIIDEIKVNTLSLVNLIRSFCYITYTSGDTNDYLGIDMDKVSKFINIDEVEPKLRKIYDTHHEYKLFDNNQIEAIKVFLEEYDKKRTKI